MVGSEISMKCVLSGSYPMTFIWIKDGCELREDEHVRMSFEAQSTELHLKNAQLSDTGTYVCEVQNTAGTQRCAAVLTVSGLSHVCGSSFVISCSAVCVLLGSTRLSEPEEFMFVTQLIDFFVFR